MAKHFRWMFLLTIAAVFAICFVSEPVSLGLTVEWDNGAYRCAGGTTPWALAVAAVIIVFYLLLMYSPPDELAEPLPGVFRRFVAFWLDFILAIFAIAPIIGLLPVLAEWHRTRVFAWTFERTTVAPSDGLLVTIGVLLTFVGLVLYYAFPLIRRKPSPGSCIAGYQIVADEGNAITLRIAILRTLLGFGATCGWFLAPFMFRDRKQGKFWLDKVFNTRALKFK
jgi:uncharacterized RDD family membrane protein YckC